MPKNGDEQNSLTESEQHLRELYRKIRTAREEHLKEKSKEATEPIYLLRYE